MLLYNLFIFLSLRDTAYFWYVMTTSGALLMILGMTGHGFQYLWPNGPVPFWLDRISIPALWGFSACRFTQTLLQTRRFVPWAHRLLTFALCLYVTPCCSTSSGYARSAPGSSLRWPDRDPGLALGLVPPLAPGYFPPCSTSAASA